MGWWITLGVVILLAVLPLGVSVRYNSEGPLVRVLLGPLKITVFPLPKKKNKKPKKNTQTPESREQPQTKTAPAPAEPAPQNPAPPPKPKEKKPKEEKGGSLLDFLPLVKLAFHFLGDFRRKLRVNVLEVNLVLAGSDPCNLAVNYGKACAALGNLWPRLEELFVIQKRDVKIQCDFAADKTLVTARLDLTITLARVFSVGARYGYRAIKELKKILNKRKGGATT